MRYSFEMALAFLKQGRKVRRAVWSPGLYLTIVDGELKMIDYAVGHDLLFEPEFDADELLEDDWEVE